VCEPNPRPAQTKLVPRRAVRYPRQIIDARGFIARMKTKGALRAFADEGQSVENGALAVHGGWHRVRARATQPMFV